MFVCNRIKKINMNITIYSTETNDILRTVTCPDNMVNLQCGNGECFIVGTVDDKTHYIVDGEIHKFSADELNQKSNIPYGYKWEMPERQVVQVLPDSAISEYYAYQVRSKRDTLLAACDWTQTADQPEATKLKWQPYRQALRDITTQTGFPLEILWPELPQ